jgi:hypothetical protein
LNRLSYAGGIPQPGFTEDDVLCDGAAASNEANQDAIDVAFLRKAQERHLLEKVGATVSFTPFSAKTRRTEAVIERDGRRLTVMKGALRTIAVAAALDEATIDPVAGIVALDETGRPIFNDLVFGRREPIYIAFDLLFVEGEDVRAAPLKERKALLEKIVTRYGLERTEPFIGEGRPLFRAVCRLDLEGIVAKRMADAYGPRAKWRKIPNREYFAKKGVPSFLSVDPVRPNARKSNILLQAHT